MTKTNPTAKAPTLTSDGKFQCPECDYTHELKRCLARHRQAEHNVPGSSGAVLYKRKAQQHEALNRRSRPASAKHPPIPTRAITKSSNGKFLCPECDAPYDLKTGLGIHRKHAHGIAGTSVLAIARRTKKQELVVTPKEKSANNEISNGFENAHNAASNANPAPGFFAVDPVVYAETLGRVGEIVRSIAEKYLVPEKILRRGFAELLFRETRR